MITSGYRNGSFIIETALTFEKEFREMIPNTKFRSVKGIFENKLKEDISKNKTVAKRFFLRQHKKLSQAPPKL